MRGPLFSVGERRPSTHFSVFSNLHSTLLFTRSPTTTMVRITAVAALLASACWTMMAGAFAPTTRTTSPRASSTPMRMAIDYNDPVVAEEFAKVQPMVYDDVAEELQAKGIPVPPTMK